ncbi:ROK family protein [Jiangella aurantiaca]|uniref:ROK family protein n=1 Tax=Jiangella aurantiaca TaxID=2530373 RepID=A0A4R5A4E3_9ACTN|nr:ROK family protein [Jiangella aurantiaca]TDD65930.1 ROK family protein [Jiangella aurantiaca]
MDERLLGIDVGGSTVKWAVLDSRTARPLLRGTIPTARDPHTVAADLAALVAEADDAIRADGASSADGASDGRITAIGVGVPGHVDRRSGVVRFLPNVPGAWSGFPLAATLRASTGRPVSVLNDARAFCLAEWRLGAARGHGDVLFLTLGTGVGGGVVSGGTLLTGPDDRLGEIGHLVYDRGGPPCGCGHRGCLETYASATAIARAAGRATAEDVFLAPRDMDAAAAVAAAGRAIGETVASLCAVLPADLLVIGGGVAAGLPRLRPYIEAALAERRDFIGMVDVVAARLGPDAGAVGAALAATPWTTTDGGGRELDRASA